MSKVNSKLFREDPAAYYTELGAEYERERIIKLLLNGWIDESSPILKEIRADNEQMD